jgi:general stress protein 26
MMSQENNLAFIKERISEIRSALLYSMSDELIRIPTSIISILRIDDEGQLWFFVKRPPQLMHDAEKKFPAKLQFYRKGRPFYLMVSGCAGIDESNDLIDKFTDDMEKGSSSLAMQNMMLVKLKITKAEYHEQKQPVPKRGMFKHLIQYLHDALFKPSYHYRPLEIKTELA